MWEIEFINTKTGENAIEFNHGFTYTCAVNKCKHSKMEDWELVCATYVD